MKDSSEANINSHLSKRNFDETLEILRKTIRKSRAVKFQFWNLIINCSFQEFLGNSRVSRVEKLQLRVLNTSDVRENLLRTSTWTKTSKFHTEECKFEIFKLLWKLGFDYIMLVRFNWSLIKDQKILCRGFTQFHMREILFLPTSASTIKKKNCNRAELLPINISPLLIRILILQHAHNLWLYHSVIFKIWRRLNNFNRAWPILVNMFSVCQLVF